MIDHLAAIRTLCTAAKLDVLAIALQGTQHVATVAVFKHTPETVVKRLYRVMGRGFPYSVGYNVHVKSGAESFTFTPREVKR